MSAVSGAAEKPVVIAEKPKEEKVKAPEPIKESSTLKTVLFALLILGIAGAVIGHIHIADDGGWISSNGAFDNPIYTIGTSVVGLSGVALLAVYSPLIGEWFKKIGKRSEEQGKWAATKLVLSDMLEGLKNIPSAAKKAPTTVGAIALFAGVVGMGVAILHMKMWDTSPLIDRNIAVVAGAAIALPGIVLLLIGNRLCKTQEEQEDKKVEAIVKEGSTPPAGPPARPSVEEVR